MKKAIVLFISFISLFPMLLLGYIEVSGNVSGQSWTGQTYFVSEDIYVNDNSTLSIAAGTVVKFSAGTSLIVNGTLDVNGTLANHVKFTSKNDNMSSAK